MYIRLLFLLAAMGWGMLVETAYAADGAPAPAAPASQPAVQADDAGSVLGRTTVGQLFKGTRKLTVKDLEGPEFWVDTLRELIIALISFIPRLIVAGVLFIVFWLIYRGLHRMVVGSMAKNHVDTSIRDMLGHIIKWTVLGFGLVIACNQVGIQITALLTGVSLIGLAIGFAAQETLANFIAGVVIFWDKPFKIGDWVEVDEVYGQVQRVTFRSTRLLDTGGCVFVFPNTHMLSSKVANHSTHPMNKVIIPIGIDYGASIDKTRTTLLGLAEGDERICKDPPPTVVVKECGDSSVNLLFWFWITDEAVERAIQFEYMEKTKKALDAAGVAIPFPHMQLLVENTPAVAASVKKGV